MLVVWVAATASPQGLGLLSSALDKRPKLMAKMTCGLKNTRNLFTMVILKRFNLQAKLPRRTAEDAARHAEGAYSCRQFVASNSLLR